MSDVADTLPEPCRERLGHLGIVLIPDGTSPVVTWSPPHLRLGAPGPSLASALGDLLEFDDGGRLAAATFIVPDKRMDLAAAVARLNASFACGYLTAAWRATIPLPSGRECACMTKALVVSLRADPGPFWGVKVADGMELTLSERGIVGWVHRDPFSRALAVGDHGTASALFWVMQMIDEEVGDGMVARPEGFEVLVAELVERASSADPRSREAVRGLVDRMLGKWP